MSPDELAQRFHEAYERLAPSFGYETRRESAVPWEEVPENNRRLMTATAAVAMQPLASRIEELEKGLRAILREHEQDADNPKHCVICAANDGYWPCVAVLEARAALGGEE